MTVFGCKLSDLSGMKLFHVSTLNFHGFLYFKSLTKIHEVAFEKL